jgi:uncharacterized protein with FMN-binding domain
MSMKRAPIVIGATVAGLAGVLTFHTKSASLTLGPQPKSSATALPGSGGTPTPSGRASTTTTSPSSASTTVPPTTRSATGVAVNYNYGILSVSVTDSGKKITRVRIATLDDGGNFRSQSIDQQSIPLLEEQALQAQSANIQGVSGASYTSAGFQKSLQSALGKLGLA